MEEKKLLSMDDLTFNGVAAARYIPDANELATYTIHKLSSNTHYKFKLAVVNELGAEGKYARIEGEYTEITAFTSKIYIHIATYVIYIESLVIY